MAPLGGDLTARAPAPGGPGHWAEVGEAWRRRSPDRLWRAHSDVVNRALLERWLPVRPTGRVMKTDLFDEAFGQGMVDLLRGLYGTVLGIDLSESVIRSARIEAAGARAVRGDTRSLPFGDAAFDVVVSISTLDHFDRLDEVTTSLREIHRVLAPGGSLVLTLDNRAHPIVWLRNLLPYRLVHALGIVPYYVGRTAGPWQARRLVAECGFEIEESGTILHCPRVLAVPVSRRLERAAGPATRTGFLRALLAFERLRAWPTAPWTGHFVAIRAIRGPLA